MLHAAANGILERQRIGSLKGSGQVKSGSLTRQARGKARVSKTFIGGSIPPRTSRRRTGWG